MENLNKRSGAPELFFGLVSTIGTSLDSVSNALGHALSSVNYETKIIHVIEEIHQIEKYKSLEENDKLQRYKAHMDAGDEFRRILNLPDALARLTILSIREKYRASPELGNRSPNEPLPATAYIIKSLKRPEEVALLRQVYGDSFFLISAYTPRETRVQNLAVELARSDYESNTSIYRESAEYLVNRDEEDLYQEYGQKVRDTFPEADFFLNTQITNKIGDSIRRFIEILFGHTFLTPTRAEYAMFHAKAAEYRSAALGRQVGAAIANDEGDILAVGTNDVPKFGGGLYWGEDGSDSRDFQLGYDTSDRKKREVLAEVLKVFRENDWLSEDFKNQEVSDLVDKASPLLKRTRLLSLIEFGRVTHAEMEALLSAARRGVSIRNCTLFTTTFPCHDCARHIVAAGIKKVVYIEPYAKSLATQFHLDSFLVDHASEVPKVVSCHSFEGISPRIYMKLFPMLARKTKEGKIINWERENALPRLSSSPFAYTDNEVKAADLLLQKMESSGLMPI